MAPWQWRVMDLRSTLRDDGKCEKWRYAHQFRLSVAAFVWQWQSWVAATETGPQSLKYLLPFPLQEFADPSPEKLGEALNWTRGTVEGTGLRWDQELGLVNGKLDTRKEMHLEVLRPSDVGDAQKRSPGWRNKEATSAYVVFKPVVLDHS